MYRNTLIFLEKWSSAPDRKSLILRGARQVGKTWVVRDVAKRLNLNLVEINFERQVAARQAFAHDLDPQTIMTNLELILNTVIDRDNTLLFFDEVQDCPQALTALKHFTDANLPVRVIAAGSYLGLVERKVEGISQPIGYVDEHTMYPMGFDEFVKAISPHAALLDQLESESLPSPAVHATLLSLYRDYLFVGGMPAVVDRWCTLRRSGGSHLAHLQEIRAMQKDLLIRYKADFAKYFPREAIHIGRTWEIVAEQLAKSMSEVNRFRFKGQIPGKRDFSGFANYFACLEACGLIYRSFIIEHPQYPLKAHKRESAFKCYYFDTGLLLAEMDFDFSALAADQDISFKGPIAENFVACELVRQAIPLFCYMKANSTAEIEFIAQRGAGLVPIEVKNGYTKAKSLDAFISQFSPELSVKCSNKNGHISDTCYHYPIYMMGSVAKHLFKSVSVSSSNAT